jgi:hypothetical protein
MQVDDTVIEEEIETVTKKPEAFQVRKPGLLARSSLNAQD